MRTLVDERPDLEIIEDEAPEKRPLMHIYCGQCYPNKQIPVGATARCGHRRTRPGPTWFLFQTPPDVLICVVCDDLNHTPCPNCGKRGR